MATDQSSSLVQAHEALHVPEIVENIISHLSVRNIIANAKRVSLQWHSVIQLWPTVQRILNRKCDKAVTFRSEGFTDDLSYHRAIPGYFDTIRLNVAVMDRRACIGDNPPTRTPYSYERMALPSTLSEREASLVIIHRMMCRNKSDDSLLQSSHATWRQMYVTDPPITTLLMSAWPSECFKDTERSVYGQLIGSLTVHDFGGIRFGLLEDMCAQFDTRALLRYGSTPEEAFATDIFVFYCLIASLPACKPNEESEGGGGEGGKRGEGSVRGEGSEQGGESEVGEESL